jgi:hypothetical protein
MPRKSPRKNLRFTVAAVAVLVSPGILGFSSVANAAPLATTQVASSVVTAPVSAFEAVPGSPPPRVPTPPRPEVPPDRAWKPLCAVATAVQIWVTGWDIWHWFHG